MGAAPAGYDHDATMGCKGSIKRNFNHVTVTSSAPRQASQLLRRLAETRSSNSRIAATRGEPLSAPVAIRARLALRPPPGRARGTHAAL
jgi:hypothetical protein